MGSSPTAATRRRSSDSALLPPCRLLWAAWVVAWGLVAGPGPSRAQQLAAPEWQVGQTWSVTRRATLNFSDDAGNSGTMNIVDAYTLRVASVATADGWPAWNCVREDGSLTGSGTATIAGSSPIPIFLGPNSATAGTELVRLGDLATISDASTWTLQVRTTVIVPVTVANGTVDMTTTFDAPFEEFDFPIAAGEAWSWSGSARATGRVTLDFVGLLADLDDIDQPFDEEAPGFLPRTVTAMTATTATLGNGIDDAATVYDATLGRAAARRLPGSGAGGIEEFREEVEGVTGFPSPPSWAFGVVPSVAASGATVTAQWVGLPSTPLPNVVLWMPDAVRGAEPVILPTGGGATFSLPRTVPTHDDGTPSNDDAGSFTFVASFTGEAAYRVVTVRRTEGPVEVAAGGVVVR